MTQHQPTKRQTSAENEAEIGEVRILGRDRPNSRISEDRFNRAGSAMASTASFQEAEAGSIPSPALHASLSYRPKDLLIGPVSPRVAKEICLRHHYLHSYPGGTFLNFGVFVGKALMGVVVLGAGPANLHRLFQDAKPREVVCLARLWLDDRLGKNCESRVLGVVLRLLRRGQSTLKALVAYSDPLAGHSGTIYRAAGFLYLGQSTAMPRYQLPDGSIHHSRSLSHSYGTHSRKHFAVFGVDVALVEQSAKLTYVKLIDPTWRDRLTRPIVPYPTREEKNGSN